VNVPPSVDEACGEDVATSCMLGKYCAKNLGLGDKTQSVSDGCNMRTLISNTKFVSLWLHPFVCNM